jgi:hypothetical protein
MKHPYKRDRFRTFLATHSFPVLIGYYLLFVATFSLFFSLSFFLYLTFYGNSVSNLPFLFWYSFAYLHGFQIKCSFFNSNVNSYFSIILSIGSVIFPTIFLGAFVFKFLIPSKPIFIMRKKISIFSPHDQPFNNTLGIYSYSSSPLEMINLKFQVYARIFSPRQMSYYQIRNVKLPITTDDLPVPILYVPILVTVPVGIIDKQLNNTNLEKTNKESNINYENRLLFRTANNKISLIKVGRHNFKYEQGDRCQLLLIISGKIPKLNNDFTEVHTYNLPEDIEYKRHQELLLKFIDNRVIITNWEDFDK